MGECGVRRMQNEGSMRGGGPQSNGSTREGQHRMRGVPRWDAGAQSEGSADKGFRGMGTERSVGDRIHGARGV